MNGNLRDKDRVTRDAQGRKLGSSLLPRNEVPVHIVMKPHGVGIEIGHDNADRDPERPLSL